MTNVKACPVCGTIVKGRSDKKFCSKKCKSIEQYESRQKTEVFYLKVDRQLKVNRRILKKYNKSGYTVIRKSKLIEEGFNPKYFTHYWKNKKGEVYLFVYEYGFLRKNDNGKEKYILVSWQNYMN
ncbi:hypothetical protein [Ascidiimonas aurantiaca]|uniref:hypothetical protein n=1 Tax=Ascidiimonas aurantiaca TaxID=1685432 RepID=UPI0030EDF864